MPGLGEEGEKENPNKGNKQDPHDKATDAIGFAVTVSIPAIRAISSLNVQLRIFHSHGCRHDRG